MVLVLKSNGYGVTESRLLCYVTHLAEHAFQTDDVMLESNDDDVRELLL
jgi:hypothetical protein